MDPTERQQRQRQINDMRARLRDNGVILARPSYQQQQDEDDLSRRLQNLLRPEQ